MRLVSFVGIALLALGFVPPLAAQLEPPSTGGAAALAQARRMLGHNKRVLVIGAHPDDEDTELLTVLVRSTTGEVIRPAARAGMDIPPHQFAVGETVIAAIAWNGNRSTVRIYPKP